MGGEGHTPPSERMPISWEGQTGRSRPDEGIPGPLHPRRELPGATCCTPWRWAGPNTHSRTGSPDQDQHPGPPNPGANRATSLSEQVIPRLTTIAPSPPKARQRQNSGGAGGLVARRSPIRPEWELPGGPTRALQTTSAGGWESVQRQLHGVGVEGAGHQGQRPSAGAPGSGSLHTHRWRRLVQSPLPEGDAGLRHYPHGSGRAASCPLGWSLVLCATSDFLPLPPTRLSTCHPRSRQARVLDEDTCFPDGRQTWPPSFPSCSDRRLPARVWPGVPWAEGVSRVLRAESGAGPLGDGSRSSLTGPCWPRCLQAVPR